MNRFVVIAIALLLSGCLTGCIWSKPIKEDAPPPPIVSEAQWKECSQVKTRSEWDGKQCSGNWPIYW